jgi:hypothetical protein
MMLARVQVESEADVGGRLFPVFFTPESRHPGARQRCRLWRPRAGTAQNGKGRRLPGGPDISLLRHQFAQWSKANANLLREKHRLFPGCKMPTLIELVVMDKFGICPLRPTAWS